jgi:pimeloyl-ACP methyl ester carboxylesterase
MKQLMHEFVQNTDRWSNRAISPLDFHSKVNMAKPIVIKHPGWGKSPEMHAKLLMELAEAGFMPIGVDTRFGYSNRSEALGYRLGSNVTNILGQSWSTGKENPFFKAATEEDNRYRLRRPTGLLSLCQTLNIESASLVGHSEGGRIISTVAAESSALHIPKLVLVNSAGAGDSSHGLTRMFRSNTQTNYVMNGTVDLKEGVMSALESGRYAVTHARRFIREKEVIQQTDIWRALDQAALNGIDITVMHARDDQLIEYEDAAFHAASRRDYVNFTPTEGGHSNVYALPVRQLIVSSLLAV